MLSNFKKIFYRVLYTLGSIILMYFIITNYKYINFYDSTIQASIISLVGAILAGFFASLATIWLSNRKEKQKESTHKEYIYKTFHSILTKVTKPGLQDILKLKDDVFEALDKDVDFITLNDFYTFLNHDIYAYFNKETLQKVILEKGIDGIIIYELGTNLEHLKNNHPGILVRKQKQLTDQLKIQKNKYAQIINSEGALNTNVNHHRIVEASNNIEIIENQINFIKDDSKLSLQSFFKIIEETIMKINSIVDNLK